MTKQVVYVVYYSTYGHVKTMADSIVEGLNKEDLVEVRLRQFPETLDREILDKMYAPPRDTSIPDFTLEDLVEGDAFMFGFPTRFGTFPGQVKNFMDSTGQLWAKGALVGKMVGMFHSTGSQSTGQETTAYSFLINLVHHGMIFVPLGITHPHQFDVSEVIGGSAFGSGTVSTSQGTRQPSEKEKELAVFQGEKFAKAVSSYTRN